MIILSGKKNDKEDLYKVHASISQMEAQLREWESLYSSDQLYSHKTVSTIQLIIAWLPNIARINVGYSGKIEWTEIIFYGHTPDPFGRSREGESIKFYEVGIEAFIFDIVMGTRALNDGLDIKVPEEEIDSYEKELLVTHEVGGKYSIYTKDSANGSWQQPVTNAIFQLPYSLFERIKHFYDMGYTDVIFAEKKQADAILNDNKQGGNNVLWI